MVTRNKNVDSLLRSGRLRAREAFEINNEDFGWSKGKWSSESVCIGLATSQKSTQIQRVIDYAVKVRVRPDKMAVVTSNVKMSLNPYVAGGIVSCRIVGG
jgi:hypothetical protein